jgi:hypothetical protein
MQAQQATEIQNGYYWDGYQWKPVPVEQEQPTDADQYTAAIGAPVGTIGGLYAGNKIAGALMGSGGPGAISNISTSMGPVEAIPGGGEALSTPEILAATRVPAGAGEAANFGLGSAGINAAAPYVAAPAAAYTGYKTATGAKKMFDGEEFDTGEKLAYALPTFGASLFFSPKDLWGSGKGEEQQKRDALRDHLLEAGFAFKDEGDKYHKVRLADGSSFNIGRDIGEGQGVIGPEGRELNWFDLNWQEPGDIKDEGSQTQMVGRLNPLAAILAGGDDQLTNQLTGYLQNAATSNEQGQENIQSFYDQAGLSERDQAINLINELKASGAIDDWEQVAYHNAINMQFGDDGSGSYDYSKLGGDPSAAHQSAYDLHFGNKSAEQIKKEEEEKKNSGENYYLE